MITTVVLTAQARKDLRNSTAQIVRKFAAWVRFVEQEGLEVARKIPGFHDEALKGDRKGQRSIRLSQAYRAIYVVVKGEVHFAEVQEVNKHKY